MTFCELPAQHRGDNEVGNYLAKLLEELIPLFVQLVCSGPLNHECRTIRLTAAARDDLLFALELVESLP